MSKTYEYIALFLVFPFYLLGVSTAIHDLITMTETSYVDVCLIVLAPFVLYTLIATFERMLAYAQEPVLRFIDFWENNMATESLDTKLELTQYMVSESIQDILEVHRIEEQPRLTKENT